MAEIRKQALLASGAQIEGLQHAGAGAPASKKVVYGNRKKKGPTAKDVSPASSRPRSPEPEPEPAAPSPPPVEEPTVVAENSAKDDWDALTDDEAAKPAAPDGVKDSWDDSSDEEAKKDTLALAPTEKATPAPTLNKSQAKGELVELLTRIPFTETL